MIRSNTIIFLLVALKLPARLVCANEVPFVILKRVADKETLTSLPLTTSIL